MIDNSAMNFTNITLFAPTDQAFQMMDRERLERLITNEDCVEVTEKLGKHREINASSKTPTCV